MPRNMRGLIYYGGGGRIRTSEGSADRFTVCSLWPLGNPSTKQKQEARKQKSEQCLLVSVLWFPISSLELAMGLEPATC